MIEYNTKNHSVFELRPSSDILNTRKHKVSENLSKGPKRLGVSLPSREHEAWPSFRNVLISSLYNKVQKPGLQKSQTRPCHSSCGSNAEIEVMGQNKLMNLINILRTTSISSGIPTGTNLSGLSYLRDGSLLTRDI